MVAVLLVAVATGARAQTPSTPIEFELSRSVQRTLARVQELWLQWIGATLQDSRARADEALRGLSVAAREVGFAHFPDLALGAVALARQSAATGSFERARRQLAAAEVLDPGRAEVAFAEAAVARRERDWLRAGLATARGLGRAIRGPDGFQIGASVALWSLLVLLVAAALFVALLVAEHGRRALAVLIDLLSPPLPSWAAAGIVAFLLVGPLALPSGVYLVVMLASALVWTFATGVQRAVLVVGWTLAIVAPLAAEALERRIALEHSPPIRALAAFDQGRLYGGFFADLQVLRSALPEDPAAAHAVADVHRTLGQWELARNGYRRLLYDEPNNVPVLLNLGAYHFRKGDYATANAHFERAARVPGRGSAAAWYNLSLGYSDAYLFDESRDALAKARELDAEAVDVWIATANPDRVLTFNGSLARRTEIGERLRAAWSGGPDKTPRRSHTAPWRSAGFSGAGVLLALIFDRLRRRSGGAPPAARRMPASSWAARWTRRVVPAIEAIEEGSGGAAWGNLVLLTAIAALPLAFDLAGDPPIAGWPGPALARGMAVVAAVAYLGVRIRSGWAEAED